MDEGLYKFLMLNEKEGMGKEIKAFFNELAELSKKYGIELKPIIEEMMEYIKSVEVYDDELNGNYREFEKIVKDGDAPEIYKKLKELKDNM